MVKKTDNVASTREKKKIQIKIAEPFQNQKPSKITSIYWIYALNEISPYPESTERSGKWLIFVPNDEIDDAWDRIRGATKNGLLGGSSKVATARPNPNAVTSTSKVICVYTYDWKDEKDVMRVREELKKLGFTQKIPYKTDNATSEGRYSVKGHTRISQYYC